MHHDQDHDPCRRVIKSDGSLRAQLPAEANEGELATLGASTVPVDSAKDSKQTSAIGAGLLWKKDVFEGI